jgi:predicted phage terminase large subunit-like protein
MVTTLEVPKAAAELLARREARRSMAAWSRACGYEPAKHHLFLIDKLEAAARGDIKRLMVFMPPGSAKSSYSSILFPPYFLAQRPNSAILVCSHSADLAEGFGRRSRNMILDKEKVLGYTLTEDSQAAGKWATTNGGNFFAAGVGGRIAGHRADLGLIDDPVGSIDDAYSELIQEKNWNWWLYDFRPRLKPDASVVLIQTRWHVNDLAGKILEAEGREWTVIKLPLVAEESDPLGRNPGEILWPSWYNAQVVADAKKDDNVFQCLWQQNPTPDTGNFFLREWIDQNVYNANDLPSNLRVYVGSDHAVSLRQEADFTCLLPGGLDEHGVLWILPDVYWDKADTSDVVDAMLAMMRRLRPSAWYAESGHISKSIGPFLTKRMREERIYTYVEESVPAKDKPTRAQSIRGRMKLGMVRWPSFAPWFPAARRELLAFPAGPHDDLVDALAHLGLGLDNMIHAERPRLGEPMHQPPDLYSLNVKWLRASDKWRREHKDRLVLTDN